MPNPDLATILADRALDFRQRLLEKVAANLSGTILQTRSGALKDSITAELSADADGIVVSLASRGVPYAAMQEYGGTTPPHDIVPVKARALALAGGLFARAHHPGSAIPARAPLGSALDALHGDIASGLKGAVREALGAD